MSAPNDASATEPDPFFERLLASAPSVPWVVWDDPPEGDSDWATANPSTGRPIAETLRDVLADAGVTFRVNTWLPRFDPLMGPCWWQWRTPCDCPDTSFGRRPHRWNCDLTPTWAQTIRDLDTNPWTVVTDAVRPIPQLEVWRRNRAAFQALIDLAIAHGIAMSIEYIGMFIGVNTAAWSAVEAAQVRAAEAAHAAHPWTLAGEWGARSERSYYRRKP